jgi:NAD(P)H-hydrate epimerase
MVKIVTVAQMHDIEQATDAAGISYDHMMERAGRAVADVVKVALGDDAIGKRIAVLVGPGNNGGDGLVAARILKEELGAEVGCYLSRARDSEDAVFEAAKAAGVFIAVADDDQRWRVLKNLVSNADIVIDALLGTGARLPIQGDMKKLLTNAANALSEDASRSETVVWPASPLPQAARKPVVVAVDCPSGLNSDTGDDVRDSADVTVTFAAAKIGQVSPPERKRSENSLLP